MDALGRSNRMGHTNFFFPRRKEWGHQEKKKHSTTHTRQVHARLRIIIVVVVVVNVVGGPWRMRGTAAHPCFQPQNFSVAQTIAANTAPVTLFSSTPPADTILFSVQNGPDIGVPSAFIGILIATDTGPILKTQLVAPQTSFSFKENNVLRVSVCFVPQPNSPSPAVTDLSGTYQVLACTPCNLIGRSRRIKCHEPRRDGWCCSRSSSRSGSRPAQDGDAKAERKKLSPAPAALVSASSSSLPPNIKKPVAHSPAQAKQAVMKPFSSSDDITFPPPNLGGGNRSMPGPQHKK